MDNEKRERILRAIELVTAMADDADAPARPLLEDFFARHVEEGDTVSDAALIIGLAEVASWLAVKLEKATGEVALTHLQDIARKVNAE